MLDICLVCTEHKTSLCLECALDVLEMLEDVLKVLYGGILEKYRRAIGDAGRYTGDIYA